MSCRHSHTSVQNSRGANELDVNGNYKLGGKIDYPCYVVRRRKCLGCGHRFTTVELPKEFVDKRLNAGSIREEIVEELVEFIRRKR